MTLEEMKAKVLLMIEEYNEDEDTLSNDEDIGNKLNTVINQIQNELSRINPSEIILIPIVSPDGTT